MSEFANEIRSALRKGAASIPDDDARTIIHDTIYDELVRGQVVPACEEGLAELERRGYTVRRVRGYSAIDQGRNQMATNAMADGFDETDVDALFYDLPAPWYFLEQAAAALGDGGLFQPHLPHLIIERGHNLGLSSVLLRATLGEIGKQRL